MISLCRLIIEKTKLRRDTYEYITESVALPHHQYATQLPSVDTCTKSEN